MDWSKGYSATYYAARVDPVTWRDLERFEITKGTVKRTNEGLRQSADIGCIDHDVGVEQWIRVYLDIRQSGSAEHVAVFTGLASTPDVDYQDARKETDLTCYSVLKPVDDVLLERGYYVMAGRLGGEVIADLLAVTPAPVTVADGSPRLTETIIAEDGESNLTMAERVLEAINWRIRVNGDGSIEVLPKPLEPVATFDPLEVDVIEPDISITTDWYSCPNVFMAISDGLSGIARDTSGSPLSVDGRGREVWAYESGCDLAENETVAEYALRKLKEAQRVAQKTSYPRRYYPDVAPSDIIRLHYPEQGLEGLYTVQSQSVELSYAARTTEDVIGAVLDVDDLEPEERTVDIVRFTDASGNYLVTDGNDYIGGIVNGIS